MTYKFSGTITQPRPASSKPGPKPQPFSDSRCGETAGYKRHIRHGVPICDACRAANTNHHRAWRERRSS